MGKKEDDKDRKQKKEKKRSQDKTRAITQDTHESRETTATVDAEEKAIGSQPPSARRARLQRKNLYHSVNLELDKAAEYALFGDDIPVIHEGYEMSVEGSRLKTIFEKGHVIKGTYADFVTKPYKIVKKLSKKKNTYIVSEEDGGEQLYFMKAEIPEPMPRASNIEREVKLLKNSSKTEETFREHFLKLIAFGKVDKEYSFMVTRLGGLNISEVRNRLAGKEFQRTDAVRLCLQTLQCIHDVHLCCFVHRDIRPENFVIGYANADQNVVYIVNFGLSFEYYPKKRFQSLLAKHSNLSRKFQPRVFHNASEYKRLDDLESWLYLCLWFFNSKCLPWDKIETNEERKICNYKDLLFHGFYDLRLSKQYDMPKFLWAVRDKMNTDSMPAVLGPINYPFYADAVIATEKEMKIDWKAPYQWQDMDVQLGKGSLEKGETAAADPKNPEMPDGEAKKKDDAPGSSSKDVASSKKTEDSDV